MERKKKIRSGGGVREEKLTTARMKNVTGVRRNGVLYGWRLRPRINHFTPRLSYTARYLPVHYIVLFLLL